MLGGPERVRARCVEQQQLREQQQELRHVDHSYDESSRRGRTHRRLRRARETRQHGHGPPRVLRMVLRIIPWRCRQPERYRICFVCYRIRILMYLAVS